VREFVKADQELVELRGLLWKEDQIAIRLLDPQADLTWTRVPNQLDWSAADRREAFHKLAEAERCGDPKRCQERIAATARSSKGCQSLFCVMCLIV
jgi:hypothetical protein